MNAVDIPAREIRLSSRASQALATGRPVAVTRYGKRSHVVLSADQFELIEPLLELLEAGAVLPAELLMTEDDIELERLLGDDREPSPGERALIAELAGEAPAG